MQKIKIMCVPDPTGISFVTIVTLNRRRIEGRVNADKTSAEITRNGTSLDRRLAEAVLCTAAKLSVDAKSIDLEVGYAAFNRHLHGVYTPIVYIKWEGRGYDLPDSWHRDCAVVRELLDGSPIEVTQGPHIVGLMVRSTVRDLAPFVVFNTRGGEVDPIGHVVTTSEAPTVMGEWEGPFSSIEEVETVHQHDWF